VSFEVFSALRADASQKARLVRMWRSRADRIVVEMGEIERFKLPQINW
jgi:hypothetical protein